MRDQGHLACWLSVFVTVCLTPGWATAQEKVADPPVGSTVKGILSQRPDGEFDIVLDGFPKRLKLANKTKLGQSAVGFPVSARVVNLDGVPAGGDVKLALTTDWLSAGRNLPPALKDPIQAHIDRLETEAKALLQGDTRAMGDRLVRFEAEVSALEVSLAGRYSEAKTAIERAGFATTYVGTRRLKKQVRKAIYGRLDNYRPETYERVFQRTRSACAIARKGDSAPYCSCALIATDAILTASHCLEEIVDPAKEIEVRFNFEQDLAGAALAVETYPILEVLTTGKPLEKDLPPMDYAMLSLGGAADGRLPGARWPVACLSTRRMTRDEAVYVVGHPQGQPRVVHDNAFVLFPYRVNTSEFNVLKLAVESEVRDRPDRKDLLNGFLRSYRKRSTPQGDVYENHSERYSLQPMIAVDSDTFHGDSGSPTFSRSTHNVIGLLIAGEDDVSEPYRPGWRAHEAILPMMVVIDQLDSTLKDWRSRAGVCVNP